MLMVLSLYKVSSAEVPANAPGTLVDLLGGGMASMYCCFFELSFRDIKPTTLSPLPQTPRPTRVHRNQILACESESLRANRPRIYPRLSRKPMSQMTWGCYTAEHEYGEV